MELWENQFSCYFFFLFEHSLLQFNCKCTEWIATISVVVILFVAQSISVNRCKLIWMLLRYCWQFHSIWIISDLKLIRFIENSFCISIFTHFSLSCSLVSSLLTIISLSLCCLAQVSVLLFMCILHVKIFKWNFIEALAWDFWWYFTGDFVILIANEWTRGNIVFFFRSFCSIRLRFLHLRADCSQSIDNVNLWHRFN